MNNPIAQWYYCRKTDKPSEPTEKWNAYRDFETEMIEKAYQAKQSEVFLDRFRLDLVNCTQYDLSDSTIQYSIFRREARLSDERFFSSIGSTAVASYGSAQAGCPFLNAWLRTSAAKRAMLDFSTVVQACVDGIRQEALLTPDKNEAEVNDMIEKLLALKRASRHEVSRFCVLLYTKQTFLYRVLNTALRDGNHSKVPTLGPLCFLIRNFGNAGDGYDGTVYRGVNFSPEVIESYKKSINVWRTWPSYTSTTKQRQVAEIWGNTLLIIRILRVSVSFAVYAFDIEKVSQFCDEQEVLLVAGVAFQVTSVDDSSPTKTIIEIKI